MSRYLILNTGAKMPTIGFGTYLLEGDALLSSLDYALHLGYRLIDTAWRYENEAQIGQVLKDRIKAGKLKRKDVFITTKISKYHLKRSAAIRCHQKSLHDLGTSYVDSVLIHMPWGVKDTDSEGETEFDSAHFTETWTALQSLFQDGSARSIGVSNFTVKQMERILSCGGPPPSHLQAECHAYLGQNKLKSFCNENKIVFTAYASLGAPAYSANDEERPKHLLSDPCVTEIAKQLNKTPAQVLLRFLIQRGMVVIPKSSKKERVKENLEASSSTWKLSSKDFDTLLKLDCGIKYFKFKSMKGHPEYFPHEDF